MKSDNIQYYIVEKIFFKVKLFKIGTQMNRCSGRYAENYFKIIVDLKWG